jgi:hypothetical protein
MFGFRRLALTIGLATLGLGVAVAVPGSTAEAQQVRFGGTGAGPFYHGGGFRAGSAVRPPLPAYRPLVGGGFRGPGAYYPRNPVRAGGFGYGYRGYGYRQAAVFPGYGSAYRRSGYYPGYGYGYGYPYSNSVYGYGYPYRSYDYGYGYGYPYYRRYDNGGAVAAGLIGGLALGAIAANAARPVYYQRPVYSDCWFERRRIVNRYGRANIRRVRVCA